jgi:6-phosphogluconolactonase/glucosamine-6-phosphate isomerase/deaminase
MKKIVAQDENDWVTHVNDWLTEKQRQYGARSLYVPAGETPKLIYKNWRSHLPEVVANLKLIQIDDVMTGARENLFKDFFREELPAIANTIEYIDTAHTQADLGLLGIGMNGHVAFHEPGIPQNFYSGCVRLQDVTVQNLDLEPGTWGKTYGAGAFLKCKSLLIIVKGAKKREILQKTLTRTAEVPASALLGHPDVTILSDFEF